MPVNALGSSFGAGSVDAVHQITVGGSYKLTGHVLGGSQGQWAILITTTDPVSIDLNGFAIQGPGPGAGGGIYVDGFQTCAYVEVFNGYLRNLGSHGIWGIGAKALEVYDVQIDNVNGIGVRGNSNLIVESCRIERCQSEGVLYTVDSSDPATCIVDDCEVAACGGGIGVVCNPSGRNVTVSITDTDVMACSISAGAITIQATGQGSGVDAARVSASIQDVRSLYNYVGLNVEAQLFGGGTPPSVTVQCEDILCQGNSLLGMQMTNVCADLIDCVSSGNSGDGFYFGDTRGSIDNCIALQNTGAGVHLAGADCRMSVSEVAAQSNGGAGILVEAAVTGTPIVDCDVRDQPVGIQLLGNNNTLLVRNTATGNDVNYQLAGTPAVILQPSDLATSNNPHANYSVP